jgi:hypothetical protein
LVKESLGYAVDRFNLGFSEIVRGNTKVGYSKEQGFAGIEFATHFIDWQAVCKICMVLESHANTCLQNLRAKQ